MKTKSSLLKVAGIIFLMYFQLIIITAINIRKEVQETIPGLVNSYETDLAEPVSEPDPESCLEDWMFDISYLNNDEPEPVSGIEAWMLDMDYLKK